MTKKYFIDKLYVFLTFFTGTPNDSSRRKIARYSAYMVIMILANILLGKNIGSMHYPWYANVSVFLLLNINIILVILLFVLLFRNIAKLIADRQKKIFGSRLQTKLIIFSVFLVTVPVFATYMLSTKLINSTINNWFDVNVERSVREAVSIFHDYISYEKKSLLEQAEGIASIYSSIDRQDFEKSISPYVSHGFIDGIRIVSEQAPFLYNLQNYSFPNINDIYFKEIYSGGATSKFERSDGDKAYFWAGVPLKDGDKIYGALIVFKKANPDMINRADSISAAYKTFQQMRFYAPPISKAFNVSAFMVLMLVIFASIWVSTIFMRAISTPLKSLASAAAQISRGKLDTKVDVIGNDEITYLSKSFNYMAAKLYEHTMELENKNLELNNALERISRDIVYIDTIYKNVDSALILFDRKLNILKANDLAEEFLEKSGQSVQKTAYEQLVKFIKSSDNEKIEQFNVTINGENKLFTAHMNKIFDTFGKIDNILLVLDDDTHIMNLQRISLWKEVATRITHEIKNPLTPIKLTAERVIRRSSDIDNQNIRELIDKSMRTIITEAEELLALVEDFNQYARFPSSAKKDVHINGIVEEVSLLYEKGGIPIVLELNSDKEINADRSQIKRVLANLVQNSMQAMEGEGGRVLIKTLSDEEYLTIIVEDNGKGIEEEDLKQIFVPYFSKKPNGTGLGLAIVKKVIDEHNGTISVETKAGEFTRFIIKFPISKGEQ